MAHAQKPDFIFRQNGRVHLNWRGHHFIRLLAAEVCASAVVMLDTPCSEVVRRVLATHSIYQFPLHFPSHASLCAITFQLDSTTRFIIQKFYVVLTLHSCVTYRSQSKQRYLLYATFTDCFCITELVSVYCAVLTDSVYKQKFFCC